MTWACTFLIRPTGHSNSRPRTGRRRRVDHPRAWDIRLRISSSTNSPGPSTRPTRCGGRGTTARSPRRRITTFRCPRGKSCQVRARCSSGKKGSVCCRTSTVRNCCPREDFAGYEFPKLPDLNHYNQWVDACQGKTETSAHFGYAGPLTEALLLGVVANRFPDTELKWDAANLKVTNVAEANKLIRRKYRTGFEVAGL